MEKSTIIQQNNYRYMKIHAQKYNLLQFCEVKLFLGWCPCGFYSQINVYQLHSKLYILSLYWKTMFYY